MNDEQRAAKLAGLRAATTAALALGLGLALSPVLAPRIASASVPNPATSTCAECLVISPDGGIRYRVVVRDDASVPVPGADVSLDFRSATGLALCTESDPDGDRIVVITADNLGVADFYVRGGGVDATWVPVSSQLQTLCLARVRSTDLDGNGAINATDETLHSGLAVSSLDGDYDCDGDSDADDRAVITEKLGNDCQTVQVAAETWGQIKSIYR